MKQDSASSRRERAFQEACDPIRQELDKCMKCGNCMAVCPVYRAERLEAGVTRAKLAVTEALLDGQLAADDPQVYQTLYNCLVCTSCMGNCPSRVDFERVILTVRSALVKRNGLPWLKRMIFSALRRPRAFSAGLKLSARLQPLVFRSLRHPDAVSPRAPFAKVGEAFGLGPGRRLPRLAVQPLREGLGEVIPVPEPRAKVAFFTGDALNHFYPEAGRDLVEVLSANGIEVHIPGGQGCCGIPVLVHGDQETARSMARRNLEAMDRTGADYLVTGCGSCGSAWRHTYPGLLAEDPVYGPRAAHWAARAFDVSTLLVDILGVRQPEGVVDAVVTYHDPCHLKKSMDVHREPRALLKRIPGLTLREMAKPDACCGCGGSYVLTHPETASAIGTAKAQDIAGTGASIVATGCPACMMQLVDQVGRSGGEQPIRHFISLLAESYRRAPASGRP